MEILYVLWALCILGGTLAESSWPSSCANIEPQPTLNTTWLKERWYIQGVYVPAAQTYKPFSCGSINFVHQRNGTIGETIFTFTYDNDHTVEGSRLETTYNAIFPDPDNKSARIIASTINETLHQRILKISENKTLIIHQCNVDKGEQFVYMLTKEVEPTKEHLKEIHQYKSNIKGNWVYHGMLHEQCTGILDRRKQRWFVVLTTIGVKAQEKESPILPHL